MNKKQIESKVRESFNGVTPQIYDTIERDVAKLNVNRATKPTTGNRSLFWKLATGVLSLVLVVMAIVGIVGNVNQTAQASTVSLDVNPSVEIVLNRNNRVVKVTALNEDGETIIAGMDFNGCQLKVAVNALIGSMLRNGYLSVEANSVLVSVDSNKNNYQSIAEAVANEITLTLGQMSIEASVVSQWIQNDDDAAAVAKQYNISLGKAQLINKIVAKTDYTVEQLVELSVNDLSLLLPNINIDDDNVNQSGTASAKQYIEQDMALQTALNAAHIEGLTAETDGLTVYKTKLDFVDREMVYEVQYAYGNYVYGAEIGARSGKVVAFVKALNGDYNPTLGGATAEVITDKDSAQAFVLELASNVEENAVFGKVFVERIWYFRGTVYEVCFNSEEMIYQYCVGSDGVVIEEYYEMINYSAEDSYLSREEVVDWFLDNNADGITRLDSQDGRTRVTSEKTVDGRLIYTLNFVSGGNQYSYKIDAVNKTILSREVSEYNGGYEYGGGWHGWGWDDVWDDNRHEPPHGSMHDKHF